MKDTMTRTLTLLTSGNQVSRNRRLRLLRSALVLMAVLLISHAAAAYSHTESGDAGDEKDAQMTFDYGEIGGSLTLDTISGTLENGDYVDAYCIEIVDPATFKATTSTVDDARASAAFDTRLYLFAFVSEGEVSSFMANDDSPTSGASQKSLLTDYTTFPGSVVNLNSPLYPGRYLLVINGFPNEVRDYFSDPIFPISSNPNALVGASPATPMSWDSGDNNNGAYTIALTGVKGCGPNIVFISESSGTGDLSTWTHSLGQSGVAGADAVCQFEAEASDLPGTYRAFMSDQSNDAYCHVMGGFSGKKANNCDSVMPLSDDQFSWVGLGPGGPVLMNDFKAAIDDDKVFYPLFSDIAGGDPGDYWTGTDTNGVFTSGKTCSDWSSGQASANGLLGEPFSGGYWWIENGYSTCDYSRHLLCMRAEIGPRAPAPPAFPSRKAFVTSVGGTGDLGSWADSGSETGLAAGDTICQARAAAAGLDNADSFIAFLSTSTVNAKDRLPNDGWFYTRVDNTILGTRDDLAGPGRIAAPLEVTENGDHLSAFRAFTGTGTDGTVAAGNTCSDWTSAPANGMEGLLSLSTDKWKSYGISTCDYSRRIYCFETAVPAVFKDGFESGDTHAWSTVSP